MVFIPVWQSARKKWRYDFKPTNEVPVYHTVSLQDLLSLSSSSDTPLSIRAVLNEETVKAVCTSSALTLTQSVFLFAYNTVDQYM